MNKRALALALVVAGTPACKRHTPTPGAAASAAAQSSAASERAIRHHGQGAEEAGLAGTSGGGGGGNKASAVRYKDPVIYVDGETRASFTYNEMPSSVKVLDGTRGTHRVLVCDYFRAIGVDCSTIKETHWYGAKGQLAVISGSELRRSRNNLGFDFTSDLSGRPRIEWESATGLRTVDKPEFVADVSIYVKMKAPKWDAATHSLLDEQGAAIDGIPYSHDDGKRGVRVNVDGRLAGKIKRNLLDGNVEPVREPKAGEEARYRLVDFLASTGVQLGEIRGIDLIVRDERVVRLSKADIESGVEFTAAKQHHGEMMFYFDNQEIPALAVDVWSKSDSPTRPRRDASQPALHARR